MCSSDHGVTSCYKIAATVMFDGYSTRGNEFCVESVKKVFKLWRMYNINGLKYGLIMEYDNIVIYDESDSDLNRVDTNFRI